MWNFSEEALRSLFVIWAKTGKAPGLLYSLVERNGSRMPHGKLPRKLFNGLLLECDLSDHVQQQIYFFGGYECLEVSLFLSLVPRGGVVVDAGANIGFYSLMLADHVGRSGQVHSFEPVPENFAALSRHIQLNGKSNVVRLNQAALWNKEESLTFSLGSQHANNCGGFQAGKNENALTSISCHAIPLVKYAEGKGLQRLDALKMDIEGAELFALEGAGDLLRKFQPVVCLEVCRKTCESFGYEPQRLWEFFEPLGYSIYQIGNRQESSGWISDFSGIEQKNVLLIPASKRAQFQTEWNDKKIRRQYLHYS